jgi:hypothetical protein
MFWNRPASGRTPKPIEVYSLLNLRLQNTESGLNCGDLKLASVPTEHLGLVLRTSWPTEQRLEGYVQQFRASRRSSVPA